jgi:glutaredoxin
MRRSLRSTPSLLRFAALGLCALAAAPSWALYKVVGPDGRVTYTDRPPQEQGSGAGRVSSVSTGGGGAASSTAALPLELRQATQRFPVTLYTTAACDPCEAARQLLRKRGVPYTERQVLTPADAEALFKLTGGREAPAASIGTQVMRGYSADLWNSYLDAAAYPKESKLPRSYSWASPTPLTARNEVTKGDAGNAAAEGDAAPADAAPAASGSTTRIKF